MSHETWQLVNSSEYLLPWTVLDIGDFLCSLFNYTTVMFRETPCILQFKLLIFQLKKIDAHKFRKFSFAWFDWTKFTSEFTTIKLRTDIKFIIYKVRYNKKITYFKCNNFQLCGETYYKNYFQNLNFRGFVGCLFVIIWWSDSRLCWTMFMRLDNNNKAVFYFLFLGVDLISKLNIITFL